MFKQLSVNNTTAAQYPELKITAVLNDAGPAGEDVIAEATRSAFVAATPEAYAHDADGNLTADARWTYTWDAENRLIAMETKVGAVVPNGPLPVTERKRLEFAYDGQSRRYAKKVFSWDGTGWELDAHTLFLYDGWNMIAELDALASNTAVRTYVWGLDLSGTFQGAGGVGGLLFAYLQLDTSTSTYAPAYDGNGNVIGYVEMATGEQSATYEYGAFGETLIADGSVAEAMPFRFSTKFMDSETSLLYYGFRYYNPSTGRWLSRDPIGERGGLNLIGVTFNGLVNSYDVLGLMVAYNSLIHTNCSGPIGIPSERVISESSSLATINLGQTTRRSRAKTFNVITFIVTTYDNWAEDRTTVVTIERTYTAMCDNVICRRREAVSGMTDTYTRPTTSRVRTWSTFRSDRSDGQISGDVIPSVPQTNFEPNVTPLRGNPDYFIH